VRKEQYRVEFSSRFAALETLYIEVDRDWETVTDNIKISAKESLGYYELKKYKPGFDERFTKLRRIRIKETS
jgi:hypothetical protein